MLVGTLRSFTAHPQRDGGGGVERKIPLPECLPCPSHGARSFTEWGLLYPSQQSCKLRSTQYAKDRRHQCFEESLLGIVECQPRSVG